MWRALTVVAVSACGRIDFDPVSSPSCNGGVADCGSTFVRGGTFARSYDVAADGMFPDASFIATVSDFRLDMFEVTVGRFRQFVASGGGTQLAPPIPGAGSDPRIAGTGWQLAWNASLASDTAQLVGALNCDSTKSTWTDAPAGNEARPINCITWFEAMAFCAWDDGFLPSEAEWNYAATGGDEQRAYPWSTPPSALDIDCTTASYMPCSSAPRDVGVAMSGVGKWGQADLAGNVWEWTTDWYAAPYPQNPCDDCANLTPSPYRAIRGGSFVNTSDILRVGTRFGFAPSTRDLLFGVRCARRI